MKRDFVFMNLQPNLPKYLFRSPLKTHCKIKVYQKREQKIRWAVCNLI